MADEKRYLVDPTTIDFCRTTRTYVHIPGVITLSSYVDEELFVFVLRVCSEDISEEEFVPVRRAVRRFFKWVVAERVMYHFVIHIEAIPGHLCMPFIDLMSRNQHVLNGHLHATAFVVQSRVLQIALNAAMMMYIPRRPVGIEYCDGACGSIVSEQIQFPSDVWERVRIFLLNNQL